MTWYVVKDNKVLVSYPYKVQCDTWCYLAGYVNYTGEENILQSCISITQEKPKEEL